MQFVSVALPIPIEKVYTYRITESLVDRVRKGSGVIVPFGKRVMTGVVTEVRNQLHNPVHDRAQNQVQKEARNEKPGFEVKDVIDLVDVEPVLSEEQLRLTEWISDYYLCSWGESIRAALPPGLDSVSEFRVRRSSSDTPGEIREEHQRLLDQIPADSDLSIKALRKLAPELTLARLRALESRGLVSIEMILRGPRTRVRLERYVQLSHEAPDEIPRGKKQQAVLSALAGASSDILQSDLLRRTGATSSTIRRLSELGFLEVFSKEMDRSAGYSGNGKEPAPVTLNQAQRDAAQSIVSAIEREEFQTFLLHGITGSGKTEVYMEALQRVRAAGKSGIILVPEIALTPQTVRRFRAGFADAIAVLHSRMSPGERFDAWRGIRSGQYPIVIGPRSAILAPVSNLGLVVVDEEHEPSYKQFDPAPRYHARDVAVMRARENSAVCVLGSATPSLESLFNARSGKFTLLTLPDRIETEAGRAKLPEVRIVDLRNEWQKGESARVLSQTLREAIEERLKQGQQTILLQNRRGYSPVIRCERCNWIPECTDCSVSMTYHKAKRHLRCHYCGKTARLPASCAACGDPSLSQIGIGTQRVEQELKSSFPDARVLRMDLDTTSTKNAHHDILETFSRGQADILLGTQMVAKGLDFGRVTLVGVIDADTGLSLPDFRAEERTFHLLTQVAGRAGRADLPGEVIFQTRNPGHRIVQYAVRHDYTRFAENILAERAALGYPPAGRLVAILFSGPDEREVLRLGNRWLALARTQAPNLQLLGPSASFIGRVRRRYRAQIMIKISPTQSHKTTREIIRGVTRKMGSVPRSYRISVDIDPVGLS